MSDNDRITVEDSPIQTVENILKEQLTNRIAVLKQENDKDAVVMQEHECGIGASQQMIQKARDGILIRNGGIKMAEEVLGSL